MKPWNVFRTWWELTKLVLAGKGGYEMNVYVNGVDVAVPDLSRVVLMPYHLDWQAGSDRYATLAVEPS